MSYTKSTVVPIHGLAIDWETSGSDFNGWSHDTYQGISFGAAVFRFDDFEIVDEIYCEIKFDESRYKWSEGAQAIHGLSREHLAVHGITQEEAAVELCNLLVKYFAPDAKIMFLGHNVAFDIGFTGQLLEQFGIMPKIHHVHLDTSGAGMIAFNRFKSNDLFELIGIPKRGNHNALADVHHTIDLAKSIRLLVQAGLQS